MKREDTIAWFSSLFGAVPSYSYWENLELATFVLGEQIIISTVGLAEVDSGLVADIDGVDTDIRCEIFGIFRPANREIGIQLVAAAAAKVSGGEVAGKPGQVLPRLVVDADITAHCGALIAPRQWGGQVPHIKEDLPAPRMTLPLEFLALTQDEYVHGQSYGVVALIQAMEEQDHDELDLRR